MATDLRDLLRKGAGHIAELPNFEEIYRRGRVIKWRRRASVTLVSVAVLVSGALVVPDLSLRSALPPATEREARVQDALPEGSVLPGRYTSSALGVPLTFDFGWGWHVSARSNGRISMARGFLDPNPRKPYGYLNVVRLERVAVPGTIETRRRPDDPIAWLEDHPYVEISGSGSFTLAGEDFVYVDGKIRSSRVALDETCIPLDVFGRSCIPLLGPGKPGSILSLPEGDRVRIAVGTIAGSDLAIVINANGPSFFGALLRHSMELLRSAHSGGG